MQGDISGEEQGAAGGGLARGLHRLLLHTLEAPPLARLARHPWHPWLVVGTVCIGAFMGQVDASIAQMILPALELDFHLSLNSLSWVSVAYLLTLAALLPVFGRLADISGRKLLYNAGFLVFILGSALCGVASGFPSLIVFRVLQAIGAALLQANSVAIVVGAVGPEHRGRAIGLQATAQAVGLSAGPAIGGLLIAVLGWRWVFWINVPFGLAGALIGWAVLPQFSPSGGAPRFDWWGMVLLAPALTGLVMLVNQGERWGVTSFAFVGCSVATAILLPLFIWYERRQSAPLLDLALFRRHAFWAGNLAGMLSYAMLFGMFFLMPFVFERGYHEDPRLVGLRLAAIPVALGLLSPLAGMLYDRAGARLATAAGMVLSLGAFAVLILMLDGHSQSLLPVTGALALFGIGQGLFTSPNNSSIMGAAPPDSTGQASGMLNVTRSFGTSVGVAAASVILAWRLGVLTGHPGRTLHAPPWALLEAAHYVILAFALFALIAGFLSWSRPHHRRRGAEIVPVGD